MVFVSKNIKMAETLFYRVLNDVISVVIVGGFTLLVISKFKKKSMSETWEDIKDFLSMREKEE